MATPPSIAPSVRGTAYHPTGAETVQRREPSEPVSTALGASGPRLPRATLVIGSEGIRTARGLVLRLPKHLRGLGLLVEPLGKTPEVWLHESALGPLGLSGNPPSEGTPLDGGLFSDLGTLGTRESPPSYWGRTYWFTKGGAGFELHVPAWAPGSPFAGLPSSAALETAVAAWSEAVGDAHWRGSGPSTSDAWLRKRAPRTSVPPPLADGVVRETMITWGRIPTEAERHYRFCHGLDLNGAYLAVAGSLELPSGEAELRDFPSFDARLPGLWHVELPEWGEAFPSPWPTDHAGQGDAWLTTPTMERAVQCAGVEALEAWVWPTHGRHLRQWQEALRDARAWLLTRGQWHGPAGTAVKHVYQRGPGRLGDRTRWADPPELDALYQPYWALAVIAESRARLHRRVMELDVLPVAVYRDAVYFLSSRATPTMLAHAIGFPVGDRLGGFKSAGTVSGKLAREILTEGRGSMANTVKTLAKVVKGG